MRIELDLTARHHGFHLAAQGEFALQSVTALFGPSGAGKSTILNAIAGFRPGIGRVVVDGQPWQGAGRSLPAHRRPVGTVFQSARLFDHWSVARNLAFARRRADRDGPDISPDHAVEALAIAGLLDRPCSALSGGERQRVAIARALLTRPRLMLMDEPLSALDRRAKASLLPMIAALPERFGIPVLFVSHQLEEIAQIAARMIAVQAGRIAGHGPLSEMLETLDPDITGRFEAGAVLLGRAAAHDAAFAMQAVELAGAIIWLPSRTALPKGQPVRVRLRARDVSVAVGPVGDLSIRNRIPARVTAIAPEDGAFAEITLDAAGQTFRARSTRLSVAELDLHPGAEVTALVKSVAFDRRLG